jgi:UDP-2,3-diacylglucosamine hydrolase
MKPRRTAADGPTAVIAGNGLLPGIVARALVEAGERPFVVMLRGEAGPDLAVHDHVEIGVAELGLLIRALKTAGARRAVLAGGVKSRPRFSTFRLDRYTLSIVPSIIRALGRGDDGLLRALIGFIESYGVEVVGAHEVVPDILAPDPGRAITRRRSKAADEMNIVGALVAARAIGALDIGQGAVAVGGRVIALEAVEGTDAMLRRVADLRRSGRLKAAGGVLVKCAKPAQEERADLPAIGVGTVENAADAGLSGIAIESGRSLILGYGETIAAADRLGLFISTFDPERAR